MTGWQVVGRIALLCLLAGTMAAVAFCSFWITLALAFLGVVL